MLAPPHKSHIVVLGWRYTLIKVFNSEDETYTLSCKVLGYIHYMSELSHALHATRNPSSFPRLHAWGRIQHLVHKWPMRFQKCHYEGTSLIYPMIGSSSSASLDQWVLLPTLENTHWRADHESQHINDLFNAQAMLNMGCAKAHTATFLSWMLYLSTAKKWGWAYPLSTLNTSELRYTGVHHNTCIAIFPKNRFFACLSMTALSQFSASTWCTFSNQC